LKTLDPRVKLFSVILITSFALIFTDPIWMLGLSLAALVLVFTFGGNYIAFLNRLHRFVVLLIVIAVVQIVFVRTGKPLLSIDGFVLVYYDGLIRGLNTGMRFFVIICSAAIMSSENSRRVIASLTQMKIPYTFAFMVMITLRFLPVFTESFSDAMTSIQLRGIELKKVKLGGKLRLYGHLLLPVVADAIVKSQDLSTAMEARGFGAMKKRTAYLAVYMGLQDYLSLVLLLLIGVGVIVAYLTII
jgi:energy-coupling factor transport system permease protein